MSKLMTFFVFLFIVLAFVLLFLIACAVMDCDLFSKATEEELAEVATKAKEKTEKVDIDSLLAAQTIAIGEASNWKIDSIRFLKPSKKWDTNSALRMFFPVGGTVVVHGAAKNGIMTRDGATFTVQAGTRMILVYDGHVWREIWRDAVSRHDEPLAEMDRLRVQFLAGALK